MGRVGTGGESLEPGIYNETKKGPSVLPRVVLFVFASLPSSFLGLSPDPLAVPVASPLRSCASSRCLTCPTSKFTLYRHSTKPPSPFRALLKIEDAIYLTGLRRSHRALNKGEDRQRSCPRHARLLRNHSPEEVSRVACR